MVSPSRRLIAEMQVALVAGLPVLPGFVAAATAALYFTDWPRQRGGAQLAVGMGLGIAGWFLVSFLFLRGLARAEGAHGGAFEQLCVRLRSLQARVPDVDVGIPNRQGHLDPVPEAYRIALKHKHRLETNLRTDSDDGEQPALDRQLQSGFRWWFAFGYVNLWRDVHRAEEALLELEEPDELYVVAVEDLARLQKTAIEGRDVLQRELQELLNARKKYMAAEEEGSSRRPEITERAGADAERASDSPVDPFAQRRARALVRVVRYGLNQRRNDLWDRLVHLRILLLFLTVLTGSFTYALLALAVIQEVDETHVTAGITYFLVGAVIGLFGELYWAARRRRGIVDDYGLSTARLLAVPLLAGIAALGGVVLTRLAGTATTTEGLPSLQEIFSLEEYPFGLVISAIFGLTPGLLLDRIGQQTEAYKKELARTAPGGSAETPAPSDGLVPAD
jgi:hypothetical protein